MAKEELKEEVKQEVPPQPQMPQMTKDQQVMMAFQARLNTVVGTINDLYRDIKEIIGTPQK